MGIYTIFAYILSITMPSEPNTTPLQEQISKLFSSATTKEIAQAIVDKIPDESIHDLISDLTRILDNSSPLIEE